LCRRESGEQQAHDRYDQAAPHFDLLAGRAAAIQGMAEGLDD
jgi:hypothetical protein